MQYYKFNQYLNYNKKPRLIIQTLDIFTLNKRQELYNFEQFLPYLYKPSIRKATKYFIGFEFVDYFIPFLRYKDKEIIQLGFNVFFSLPIDKINFKPELNNKYKGYKGMDRKWDFTFDKFKLNNPQGINYKIDSLTFSLMEIFLDYCKKQNLKVIFVYTPEYIENQYLTNNRNEIFKIYNDLSKKYNVLFLDYSKDSISYNKNFFYNSQHLNKKGSELFSQKLAIDIKANLNW